MDTKAKILAIGLDEKVANSSIAPILEAVVEEAGVSSSGCDKAVGNLLYTLASTLPKSKSEHRAVVSRLISSRAIRSVPQVNAASKFLTKLPAQHPLDRAALEAACGAGVYTTPEQIASVVGSVLKDNHEMVAAERYSAVGKILGLVNKELPWADGKSMKEELDKQVKTILGEMSEEDKNPQLKKKSKEPRAESKAPPAKDVQDVKAGGMYAVTIFPFISFHFFFFFLFIFFFFIVLPPPPFFFSPN